MTGVYPFQSPSIPNRFRKDALNGANIRVETMMRRMAAPVLNPDMAVISGAQSEKGTLARVGNVPVLTARCSWMVITVFRRYGRVTNWWRTDEVAVGPEIDRSTKRIEYPHWDTRLYFYLTAIFS